MPPKMSYRTLRDFLNSLGDDPRLDDTATVYVTHLDEYIPCDMVEANKGHDVLDEGHLFIMTADTEF